MYKIQSKIFNLKNNSQTKNSDEFNFNNDTTEFLCWKNLKILRKNEEKKDKKKVENININIE